MQLWRQGRVRAVERVHDAVEADGLVLTHLSELGCDPRQPRECRHYLYVPGEPGARAVASSLNAAEGWDAEVEEVRHAWLVTATTVTGLDHDVVRGTRARLERLADEHGGEYDGWEAAADAELDDGDAAEAARPCLVRGLEQAVGVLLPDEHVERGLRARRPDERDHDRDRVQVQRLGQPLDRDALPDVGPTEKAAEQRHARRVLRDTRAVRVLRWIVVAALSAVFFVLNVVVVGVLWAIAAPLAFVLGLVGWAAIRGTHEEKFVWGERVLQTARAASERFAQIGWKTLDRVGRG